MTTWSEYQEWLHLSRISSDQPAPTANKWHTDSRTITHGDWFIPLVGEKFDGHQFIAAAMDSGAFGFLYNQSYAGHIPNELKNRGIAVNNTLLALQNIAHGWRRSLKNCTFFGLTGSSGKTTTREMLASSLTAAGKTYSNKKNFNNEIGVALTLCQITEEHRYAVLEFGARHTGDIAQLSVVAEPDICCLLNVGRAHLGVFGSLDALLNAKLEIFTSSKSNSIWVVNADDAGIMTRVHHLRQNVITFGESSHADVRIIKSLPTQDNGMLISIAIKKDIITLNLSTFHSAHPLNAAACFAMAHAAGISPDAIKTGIESFSPLIGRFFQHRFGRKIVIDDTYNANPESMRRGLESLQSLYPQPQKTVILGDMLELGPESENYHRELGRFCYNAVGLTHLYTVGMESERIGNELVRLGFNPEKVQHFPTAQAFIEKLDSILLKTDIFYVKGSRSIRLDTVIDAIRLKTT